MPVMDGLEALQKIKQSTIDSEVIMVTAQARPEIVNRARELGASGFIIKPFEPEKVMQEFARLFKLPLPKA